MFARVIRAVMIGLTGIFLLGVGLTAFGLTSSPRPADFTGDLYSRMRQMEWVVAFIFVPLGMWFVRMTVARLSNLSDESKANEAIVGRPPKVKPQAVILLIVAFGAFVTAAVIFRNHYAPEPPPPRQSAIASQGR